jgi:hypothetical protein
MVVFTTVSNVRLRRVVVNIGRRGNIAVEANNRCTVAGHVWDVSRGHVAEAHEAVPLDAKKLVLPDTDFGGGDDAPGLSK